MPYTINKYNGTPLANSVADGTIDTQTDLKLIGKNYAGYGEIQNENFVFLLENFANPNPPPKPLSGQLWYDSSISKLKFYDGVKFRTTGGSETGPTAPTGSKSVGDFWFDTVNKQLYAWNGNEYTLVGPQGVAGSGTTQMISRSVRESGGIGAAHAIIEARVNGQTVFVVNPDAAFTLDSASTQPALTGFTKIHQGITLAYTEDETNHPGQTTNNYRLWGTATDADRLGGYDASSYVRSGTATFSSLVNFADVGFTVGATPRLRVWNSGTTPIIQNTLNDLIVFKTQENIPMQLVGNDILPGTDNTNNIGSTGNRFATVYAMTFSGTATQAGSLAVGSSYAIASAADSVGTIAARTSVDQNINGTNITAGAIKATYFVGTATAANYADLAERYLADAEYEVGTVLMIGGDKEVTACQVGFRAVGPVSENPAYLMNFELEGGTPVALKGRVPVKMTGSVKKGQRLVAGPNGTAQAAMGNNADVFAIALESSDDISVRLVECLIL